MYYYSKNNPDISENHKNIDNRCKKLIKNSNKKKKFL